MDRYQILFLLAGMPFVHTIAQSQDSLAAVQGQPSTTSFSILLERGFFSDGPFFRIPPDADQRGYHYSAAFGTVPQEWWHPSIHLWITYDEYHYYRSYRGMDRRDEYLVGIYPTLRLFSFILIGYGNSFGNRSRDQWDDAYPVSNLTHTGGRSTKWSYILGIDINIYIAYNFYIAVGIIRKEPMGVTSIGIARTF
jgi:hypothetical protein